MRGGTRAGAFILLLSNWWWLTDFTLWRCSPLLSKSCRHFPLWSSCLFIIIIDFSWRTTMFLPLFVSRPLEWTCLRLWYPCGYTIVIIIWYTRRCSRSVMIWVMIWGMVNPWSMVRSMMSMMGGHLWVDTGGKGKNNNYQRLGLKHNIRCGGFNNKWLHFCLWSV